MTTAESFDTPLRIVVRRQGAHYIVELAGSAGIEHVALLEQQLGELRTAGAAHVILDCSKLAFINSGGIGAIVAAHTDARKRGGSVRIAQPTRNVDRMLRLTHLDHVIPLHATLDDALSASA